MSMDTQIYKEVASRALPVLPLHTNNFLTRAKEFRCATASGLSRTTSMPTMDTSGTMYHKQYPAAPNMLKPQTGFSRAEAGKTWQADALNLYPPATPPIAHRPPSSWTQAEITFRTEYSRQYSRPQSLFPVANEGAVGIGTHSTGSLYGRQPILQHAAPAALHPGRWGATAPLSLASGIRHRGYHTTSHWLAYQ